MTQLTAKPFTARPLTARPFTAYQLGQSTSGAAFDYYVDSVNGNDANDGLSAESAWSTLGMISTISVSSGDSIRVLVKSGTYSDPDDTVSVDLGSQENVVFTVVFEPGCVIDGTAFTDDTQNGITYGSSNALGASNNCFFYGNGCQVINVLTADGNGLDGYGYGTAHFYDFNIDNCRDGISMHVNVNANFYDVTVTDCVKWAVAHVGTGEINHYRCSFSDENNTATLGGMITVKGDVYFESCVFLPGTTNTSQKLSAEAGNVVFDRCQLGTLSRRVNVNPNTSTSYSIQRCFVNAFYDGLLKQMSMEQCYGMFTARTGAGAGSSFTMENCVITAPATGQPAIFFSNYNPVSSIPFYIRDNIFKTATAAAFMSIDANNSGYLVAAGSEFFNNILNGSAAYDADLIAADTGDDVIVGTLTSDALIGDADSLLMADYAYGEGSPAIGAGISGGDIGFGSGDVVSVGAA